MRPDRLFLGEMGGNDLGPAGCVGMARADAGGKGTGRNAGIGCGHQAQGVQQDVLSGQQVDVVAGVEMAALNHHGPLSRHHHTARHRGDAAQPAIKSMKTVAETQRGGRAPARRRLQTGGAAYPLSFRATYDRTGSAARGEGGGGREE